MAEHGLLERNQIVDFPVLQLALAALKQRVDVVTVRSRGYAGAEEDVPLLEIRGRPTDFRVRILADTPDYLDWLNAALLRSGIVEPVGLTAVARRLAEYEDIVLGVDKNLM